MTKNGNITNSCERILLLKRYMMALIKKMSFVRTGLATMSESQRNDVAIEEYRIMDELNQLHKKLIYMDRVFTTQILFPYLNEINAVVKELDFMVEKIKVDNDRQFEMQMLLDGIKWDNLHEMSFKERVAFYKEVRSIIQQINE